MRTCRRISFYSDHARESARSEEALFRALWALQQPPSCEQSLQRSLHHGGKLIRCRGECDGVCRHSRLRRTSRQMCSGGTDVPAPGRQNSGPLSPTALARSSGVFLRKSGHLASACQRRRCTETCLPLPFVTGRCQHVALWSTQPGQAGPGGEGAWDAASGRFTCFGGLLRD